MVLLSTMLRGSMVAVGALLALLTVPTLHIPLHNAAVHGATRLRVYLSTIDVNRGRRRPTNSVIVPPVPQEDPAVQEEVMDLQVSTSLDTAESTEPEARTSSDGSESIEAAVGPCVSMSQEGADVQVPSTRSTSNIVHPAGPAESVQLVAEVRYWFSMEQQRDTCPGLYSALRASPSRSRPVYPIVPPPGALIVRDHSNDQARAPVDLWVIVVVAIPSVFIISMVLRRCARNNSRRRFPALELSVSSEVAGDSSNEVDTGGVDDNIDTTFEQPTERIEATPNSHDVALPSPTPRFAPVMERTPNMDGSSESEAGSGSTPSTSFVATAPPVPEPSINSESEASAADFQDAHPQVPANVLDNTGRTTESIDDLCVSHSRLPTSSVDMLPRRAVSEYNGVRYLYVPHFQFTVYLDGMAQAAPAADTSNNLLDFSAPLASLSNARGSSLPLSISPPSDHPVTSNVGASPSSSGLITSANPDTSYPANADAEPTPLVPTAHASLPLIIITEASESLHASPATCNDIIHAQDAVLAANPSQSGDMATPDRGGSTEASAVLLPDGPSAIMTGTSGVSTAIGVDISLPSGVETQAEGALHPMMTGAGIEDLNEGLAVATVAGPSLVVASNGRTEDLEAYSDHHREQSVASTGTHHPEDNDRPARATKQARKGPQRVREFVHKPSPLGLYSYVPCSQEFNASSAPIDMVEPRVAHAGPTRAEGISANVIVEQVDLSNANDQLPTLSQFIASGLLVTSQSPLTELQEDRRIEGRSVGTPSSGTVLERVETHVDDDLGAVSAAVIERWRLYGQGSEKDGIPTDITKATSMNKRMG